MNFADVVGRLDDAKELFDRAKTHPLAVVGRAALALDRGDAASAGDLAERYLRAVPVQNRTERVAALELLIRAKLSLGSRPTPARPSRNWSRSRLTPRRCRS